MRIVVALGSSALGSPGGSCEASLQQAHVIQAVASLAPLARCHELVVTYGSNPSLGLLALETASDPTLVRPYPYDVLGAETQGMVGYWLVQALGNAVGERPSVAVLCRTVVDPADPAFLDPTVPVGPYYEECEAHRLACEWGWHVRADGPAWRRVVAAPQPLDVVELPAIMTLLEAGSVVVCSGGGGVPVTVGRDGRLRGVEAVVDKDLTAAVVAEALGADQLLIMTDVPAVQAGWGTPDARPLGRVSVERLRAERFDRVISPKVEAACRFVESTGRGAAIGRLEDVGALVSGVAGTQVLPHGDGAGRSRPFAGLHRLPAFGEAVVPLAT